MRLHWKPQLLPPCMKYHPSPSLLDLEPHREGTHANRRHHLANRRLREHAIRLPEQRELHLDREPGQIRRRGPQACSGLLRIDVPWIAHACACAVVRASRLFLAIRRQWLLERAVAHADRIQDPFASDPCKRLPDDVHQGELLNQHRATRILEAGQRRALQTNGPEI